MTLFSDTAPELRWFNAHCHLELSHLGGAVPPGLPFTEWLGRIVSLKRATNADQARLAAENAIAGMRARGCGALLNICSMGPGTDAMARTLMPGISFFEIIDFDPALGAWAVQRVLEHQAAAAEQLPPEVAVGLSPHAPYTTTPRLLREAARVSRARRQWLCVHCAETPEETEFLVSGTGDLRDFLDAANLLPPGWQPPELRPVPYLHSQGALGPNVLLAHLNEIDDTDLRLLQESGTRAVVCPGTHVYFDRGEFPLRRLLEAGVPTYLGTDSLASNESLDMNREIDLACALSPGVSREQVEHCASIDRWTEFQP